jgi:guanylate kinase
VMRGGELFLVAAPSGSGKDTLIDGALAGEAGKNGALWHSVSHTTRRARSNEKDGVHYFFVDRKRFGEMISGGEFLEWAEYNGNLYGTSRGAVLSRLEQGIDVILDIDVQGVEQVLERIPTAHAILVLPPSY